MPMMLGRAAISAALAPLTACAGLAADPLVQREYRSPAGEIVRAYVGENRKTATGCDSRSAYCIIGPSSEIVRVPFTCVGRGQDARLDATVISAVDNTAFLMPRDAPRYVVEFSYFYGLAAIYRAPDDAIFPSMATGQRRVDFWDESIVRYIVTTKPLKACGG